MYRLSTRITTPILALPRPAKRMIALCIDVGLCILSVWIAYYLRLGYIISISIESEWTQGAAWAALASVGIGIPIFIVAGLYRAIFRYSGWPAFVTVVWAIGVYGLLYGCLFTLIGVVGVPRTVGIIQPMLLLILIGTSRIMARFWLGDQYLKMLRWVSRKKVLIYGAGGTGRQLANAITSSPEMQVVGFLDDDDRLHGHVLNGLPIYNPADLDDLVTTLCISDVLLAMPNLSRSRRNEILGKIRYAHVAVRTLPNVSDLAQGKMGVSDLQELDIDDLLGREVVTANHLLMAKNIVNKVVLVTGAGGSIGSELCRQIVAVGPAKLLLVEQSEFALYAIHQELEAAIFESKKINQNNPNQIKNNSSIQLIPLIASVQHEERIAEIMATWHPHTIYHAAAYKHVPLVEHNPIEGIKNNVFGTLNVAKIAQTYEVANMVLISTDKAVRPTNIMGASKRLAEMVLQSLADAKQGKTKFSMVRFGNVLDSSGSVVPKFRKQIKEGGPITLTHPEITRYFMTIPEASQLVIQSGAMAKGGDVFILDMGKEVKIIDLAKRMIELSGLTVKNETHPEGDIAIEITGLRPGEKLYEELLIGENAHPTSHPRIMKAHEEFLPWNVLETQLKTLQIALDHHDVGIARQLLMKFIVGYQPTDGIMDWIYLEHDAAFDKSTTENKTVGLVI